MVDAVVNALLQYFQQPGNAINLEDYLWPRRNPVGAEETIQQRHRMSEDFHASAGRPEAQFEIARRIVVEWGGINSLSHDVLAAYVQEGEEITVVRGLSGIASWSKVLAVKDPSKYMIYDARVAFAINYIIHQHDHDRQLVDPARVGGYLRQPPTRNTIIKSANTRRREQSIRWNVHGSAKGRLLYPAYLRTIHRVATDLGASPIHIEMMLFARAPAMAAKAFQ